MNRTERLIVRLNPEELAQIKKKAGEYGMTMSQYVRVLTLEPQCPLTVEEMDVARKLCDVRIVCSRLLKVIYNVETVDLKEVENELNTIRLVAKYLEDKIC